MQRRAADLTVKSRIVRFATPGVRLVRTDDSADCDKSQSKDLEIGNNGSCSTQPQKAENWDEITLCSPESPQKPRLKAH